MAGSLVTVTIGAIILLYIVGLIKKSLIHQAEMMKLVVDV
jgi:hypothetical protein